MGTTGEGCLTKGSEEEMISEDRWRWRCLVYTVDKLIMMLM
jgi:hypothetical protein